MRVRRNRARLRFGCSLRSRVGSKALFEPQPRKIGKRVYGVAAVVEADLFNGRQTICVCELLWVESMMVKPGGHELVKESAVRHAHKGTDGKLLFVRSRVAHTPIISHSG